MHKARLLAPFSKLQNAREEKMEKTPCLWFDYDDGEVLTTCSSIRGRRYKMGHGQGTRVVIAETCETRSACGKWPMSEGRHAAAVALGN
ncbi:hypothetical protein EPI10_032850 [Gossypium australe]|uniref:Uncharacterized protein n=1 Tax=Gossypium australe TaxID=47621 RepID=A0A5B6X606_9ROSI|nr:hypothetical protein EPI10_032850 [Gossypium australe]